MTMRPWRLATAALVSAGLLGTGVAIGASTADPAAASRPAAASPAAVTGTTSYSSVVRQVVPSVVQIRTQDGLGSGVILDDKGHIVTNAHVTGDATRFQVQLADDPAPRSAHLVGSYRPDDLAVIRADDADGLKPARLGDSSQAKPGDMVLAVGNPLGLTSSITDGIISATGRAVTEPGSGTRRPRPCPTPSRPARPSTPATAAGRWSTWPRRSSASPRWPRPARATARPRRASGSPSRRTWSRTSPARSLSPGT